MYLYSISWKLWPRDLTESILCTICVRPLGVAGYNSRRHHDRLLNRKACSLWPRKRGRHTSTSGYRKREIKFQKSPQLGSWNLQQNTLCSRKTGPFLSEICIYTHRVPKKKQVSRLFFFLTITFNVTDKFPLYLVYSRWHKKLPTTPHVCTHTTLQSYRR